MGGWDIGLLFFFFIVGMYFEKRVYGFMICSKEKKRVGVLWIREMGIGDVRGGAGRNFGLFFRRKR
jgi:hypothetical protein